MKKENLTPAQKAHYKRLAQLEAKMNKEFHAKLNLHEKVKLDLNRDQVEFEMFEGEKRVFASDVTVYCRESFEKRSKKVEMNFGTNGSFNPTNPEDIAATVRTLTATEIINNWEWVAEQVQWYTEAHETLIKAFVVQKRMTEK